MPARIEIPEKDVQAVAMDWMNSLPGVTVWRQNRGVLRAAATATTKRRFVKFGQPGQSDIGGIVAPYGVMLQVEIKRRGEEPSLVQLEWIGLINRCGGLAFWCDSLESCVTQLSAEFMKRGWDWSKSWNV